MAKGRMAKIGAIWSKRQDNGDRYLSISLDCPVIIADPERFGLVAFEFKRPNGEARRDTDPMFTLHISEQRQQQADSSDFDDEPAQRGNGQRQTSQGRSYDDEGNEGDPFADDAPRPQGDSRRRGGAA